MIEDIIRMAREAGLRSAVILHLYGGKEGALCDSEIEELAQIERFFHMAQAAEREACAEVCDSEATIEGIAQRCAAAIRARGQA
jgi:hypothetical protein